MSNFWGQGAPGQPFPPGSGRGGACIPGANTPQKDFSICENKTLYAGGKIHNPMCMKSKIVAHFFVWVVFSQSSRYCVYTYMMINDGLNQ